MKDKTIIWEIFFQGCIKKGLSKKDIQSGFKEWTPRMEEHYNLVCKDFDDKMKKGEK